jgi:hypothetical protein
VKLASTDTVLLNNVRKVGDLFLSRTSLVTRGISNSFLEPISVVAARNEETTGK